MKTIKQEDVLKVKKLLNKTPKTLRTLARKTGFSRNKVDRIIDVLFTHVPIVRYTHVREGERGCESLAYYV